MVLVMNELEKQNSRPSPWSEIRSALAFRARLRRLHERLRFGLRRPERKHEFHIVSAQRNAGEWAIRCLESVYRQTYDPELVTHVFIDDASTDGTDAKIEKWLAERPRHRVSFIRNRRREGLLANNLAGFRLAKPSAIVLELNGDDWLSDRHLLEFLNKVYADQDTWMTYNTYKLFRNGVSRYSPHPRAIPEEVIKQNAFREYPWVSSHLHSFRARLFAHADPASFNDPETGGPWEYSTDQAIYLPLLELAGTHARALERITYIYNLRDISVENINRPRQKDCEQRIRLLPRYVPLKELAQAPPPDEKKIMDNHPRLKPELSVVLCSYNGEKIIGEAIESLVRQDLAHERYEIVAVDNGSSDNTGETVKTYLDRFPHLVRMVKETIVGLSAARNAGINAARAPIIVFFEDDARAEPQWLQSLLACFDDPEIGAAGGPIKLKWECERPPWWEHGLDPVLGRLDHGDRARRLTYPDQLWGGNLAVRRSVFSSLGLFRTGLGRRGRKLMAGEDIELCLRIWKAGWQIAYEPRAAVFHLVRAERVNMRYIRRQAYWHGRSKRMVEHLAGWKWSKRLPFMPIYLAKGLAGWALKHRLSRARQGELIYEAGYFFQGLSMLFSDRKVESPPLLSAGMRPGHE
ncbi:MAG TPA: glycosyltransferase family 2 protein [bacterium]|nr:glycosyltransferase family 2 protein [bacterium]